MRNGRSSTTYVTSLVAEVCTKEYRLMRKKLEFQLYCIDTDDTGCDLITLV